MGIKSFMGSPDNDKATSRVERCRKACKGKSKEERRKIERSLLAPEELPPYTGEQPTNTAKHPLSARSIKFTFHSLKDMELFKKHFRVSKFVEQSVADPSFLVRFLKALEEGEIRYLSKKDKFKVGKRV